MVEQYRIETTPSLQFIHLPRTSIDEYFITVSSGAKEGPDEAGERLRACMKRVPDAKIVKQDMFGLDDALGRAMEVCTPSEGAPGWPITRVTAGGPTANPFAGIHSHLISGVEAQKIQRKGRPIGVVYEDEFARYCSLADIRPDDPSLPRGEQAYRAFDMMEDALGVAGMKLNDVVRTWLYLDRILDWYDEFNAVRTQHFKNLGVFEKLVPASTGVGSPNPAGTAIVADALAVKPKTGSVGIKRVPSPLQCPAPEYGSSFSRAVEISTPDCKRLLISGTASIEPGGKTMHVGDIDKQIDLTMKVVEAILESRQMNWNDVTRAIAYFKSADDMPAYSRWCAARDFPQLPLVVAQSDICRDDLLYEIELDAVRGRAASQKLDPMD